ncbi:MAG: diguanylate cyclase, partial [Aquificota bacterium]
SIGVESIIPDENTDIQHVISLADKKLYEAKKTGKNKIVY